MLSNTLPSIEPQINLLDLFKFAHEVIDQNELKGYWVGRWCNIIISLEILSQLTTEEIITKLNALSMPKKNCWLRHHILWAKIGEVLHTPENCPYTNWNPWCGHLELNGIAALLILGEFLVREKYKLSLSANLWPILWVLIGPKRLDILVQGERGVPNWIEALQQPYWKEVVDYAHWLAKELQNYS